MMIAPLRGTGDRPGFFPEIALSQLILLKRASEYLKKLCAAIETDSEQPNYHSRSLIILIEINFEAIL
jgi:hypothetical protein